MAGWANGNGMTYKKFYWASSGNTSGCTQLFSTGASRYGVSTSVGTPTMSISGDYTNFSFTFSDGQGAKMEKLKIHFEYFLNLFDINISFFFWIPCASGKKTNIYIFKFILNFFKNLFTF